jgi:hypothetical protein
MPNASNISTAAVKEEDIVTICTLNHYLNPLRKNFSSKCIWNILNTELRKDQRVKTPSKEGREKEETGGKRETKKTERSMIVLDRRIESAHGLEIKRSVEEKILMVTEVHRKEEILLTNGIRITINEI